MRLIGPSILAAWLYAAMSSTVVAVAHAETPVDLELVLAVDISGSIDPDELQTQRWGYIAALTDPQILSAIRHGEHGRIAVTYVEWSGPQHQIVLVPWRVIDSAASAQAVADILAAAPAKPLSSTSISAALLFAAGLFDGDGFAGSRRIIDISGDGPNISGPPLATVRYEIVGRGIVINGLPLADKPFWYGRKFPLVLYYRDCVIGGDGAFMVPVRDLASFAVSVRRKFLLEVAGDTLRRLRLGVSPYVLATQRQQPGLDADCRPQSQLRDGKPS